MIKYLTKEDISYLLKIEHIYEKKRKERLSFNKEDDEWNSVINDILKKNPVDQELDLFIADMSTDKFAEFMALLYLGLNVIDKKDLNWHIENYKKTIPGITDKSYLLSKLKTGWFSKGIKKLNQI